MPVVHDALSAVIAEKAGFKAIAAAGYANSASMLGRPDIGLLTLTEMTECARRIVDAVSLPVFADGDAGHGGVNNVMRTVNLFEKAGAQALMLEDQISPKRCGHMSGKRVVSTEEMTLRLKAALRARTIDDMLIVARTDSLQEHGLEEAIERSNTYLDYGADMVFIEAPNSREELKTIPRRVKGPVMANMIPGGVTPLCSAPELEKMGYALVAYPTLCTHAMAKAVQHVLQHLIRTGDAEGISDQLMGFQELHSLMGLEDIRREEQQLFHHSSKDE